MSRTLAEILDDPRNSGAIDVIRRKLGDPLSGSDTSSAIRRGNDKLRSSLSFGTRIPVTAKLSVPAALSVSVPSTATASHSWSVSYTSGGETIGDLSGLVTGFVGAFPQTVNGYTFTYDSGSQKLQAFTTAGTEVVATTNLQAAVGTTKVHVVGTTTSTTISSIPLLATPSKIIAYTAVGSERLAAASFVVSGTPGQHATNYWNVALYVLAPPPLGVYGEIVGTTTSASRGLTSGQTYSLYASDAGLPLIEGSQLFLLVWAQNTSATAIGDVTLTLEIVRKVT